MAAYEAEIERLDLPADRRAELQAQWQALVPGGAGDLGFHYALAVTWRTQGHRLSSVLCRGCGETPVSCSYLVLAAGIVGLIQACAGALTGRGHDGESGGLLRGAGSGARRAGGTCLGCLRRASGHLGGAVLAGEKVLLYERTGRQMRAGGSRSPGESAVPS